MSDALTDTRGQSDQQRTRPSAAQLRPAVQPLVAQYVETAISEAMVAQAAAFVALQRQLAEETARATAAEAALEAALAKQASRYETDDRLTLTPEKVLMWLERNGYR